jgi:ribosomal protein S21
VVIVVRDPNENNEHLVQRFKKAVRAARLVVELKKARYHSRAKTKKRVREEAIMRSKHRETRRRQQLVA